MRYKVIAERHKVFRKSFGEYFERYLPEAQERHLIGGGFIIRAPKEDRPVPTPLEEPPVEEPATQVEETSEASEQDAENEPRGDE
jgi:hypothetical protein